MTIDNYAEQWLACYRQQDAAADADEGETPNAGGPASFGLEGDGVGDETEIETAIDDGDVDVPEDATID